jgi:hypothetical protein
MEERVSVPRVNKYHPNKDFVLKTHSQGPSIPALESNPGKEFKAKIFEEKTNVCDRLLKKMTKGFKESESLQTIAQNDSQAHLDMSASPKKRDNSLNPLLKDQRSHRLLKDYQSLNSLSKR